jgi:hypothetical protein
MLRWLSIPVVALALVAAGCGGGSNESAATTETTTTETATTDAASSQETTTNTSTGTTDLSGILGNKDCLALLSIGATMAQAAGAASGSTDNQAQLDALASKVPDEIKSDVETLAQAYAAYASKIKGLGLTVGSTPTADQLQQLQAAGASLQDAKVTAASNHLQAWAKGHCKS